MAGVLALAVTHRLERLGTRNLWQDEAFSLDVARLGIQEIIAFLPGKDPHPPGYYSLLSLWIRLVGDDLAAMRALSALFGIAAVLLTWRFGRRLFSPAVGVGAAALLALNPFQIFASNELRMYMPLEFVALGSTWLLWRAHQPAGGYAWWVAYGASLALMAYISYYSFLLFAAHGAWILLRRSLPRHLPHLGVAAFTALILYAPWIPHLGQPITMVRWNLLGVRAPGLWATWLPEVVASQTFGGYLFNMMSYHTIRGLDLQYYGIFLFPFLVLIAVGAGALGRLNPPARSLIAACWVVPVVIVIAASLILRGLAAYTYHLNFLQPFLALFVAAGIVHFHEAVARAPAKLVTLLTITGVLVFVAPAVDNLQWNPDYQSYRYDSAARLVQKLYRPGDVVVYFPEGVRRGFTFYFDPPGKEYAITTETGYLTRELLRDPIDRMARSLTQEDRRVWVVFRPPYPDGAVEDLLETIGGQGYRHAITNDFRGVYVGLLVRPAR
jgi:uncharacterized membrane protein